jgi:hypothetical protein
VENEKLWHLVELYDFLIKNQNRSILLKMTPEAACLTTLGLYSILDQFNFDEVEIITANALERHDKYKITIAKSWYFFDKFTKPVDPALQIWNQQKLFLCLYGRPTAARLGLLSYMHKHHAKISLLGCQAHLEDEDDRVRFVLDKLFQYRAQSLLDFSSIKNDFPLTIPNAGKYERATVMLDQDIFLPVYKDILVDVVAETFVQGKTFFPTEKTSRPIMLKKPMIVMASRNYLDYLHQVGFKTFNNFWSEDYDGYEGKERFLRILELLDTLAKKSTRELEQMYIDMQPILAHNFSLLQSRLYHKKLIEIS